MRDVGEGSCRPSTGRGVPTRKGEPGTTDAEEWGGARAQAPSGPQRSESPSRTSVPGGAAGRRDIGELQKGNGLRTVPGGSSGSAGRGNVTRRVCLPLGQTGGWTGERPRGAEGWGARGRAAPADSLTCGAPGSPGPPAAGVRARGRASAGHSTWSSRVRAARKGPGPHSSRHSTRARAQRGGRGHSLVAWATAPPPKATPPPARGQRRMERPGRGLRRLAGQVPRWAVASPALACLRRSRRGAPSVGVLFLKWICKRRWTC